MPRVVLHRGGDLLGHRDERNGERYLQHREVPLLGRPEEHVVQRGRVQLRRQGQRGDPASSSSSRKRRCPAALRGSRAPSS
ncbi:hypothetical protein ACR6C2_39185 [Streptomyces sp. INA 01156]